MGARLRRLIPGLAAENHGDDDVRGRSAGHADSAADPFTVQHISLLEEAVGHDAGADVFFGQEELAESGVAEEQVADEDEGPAIADEVEAGCERAERARH